MRHKKLPPLIHEEMMPAKQRVVGRPHFVKFSDKPGSHKKGVARPLEPTEITRALYLEVANLKTRGEIDNFLRRYPFFSVIDEITNQPRKAVAQDIERFRNVITTELVKKEMEFINQQLAACYPQIVSSSYTSWKFSPQERRTFEGKLEATQKRFDAAQERRREGGGIKNGEDFDRIKQNLESLRRDEREAFAVVIDEYAMPRSFSTGGPRRNGGYFARIVMMAASSMSACCYYFVQSIADGEKVRMCANPNCGRVFLVKDHRQNCGEEDCKRKLNNEKRRRSYANAKTRQAGKKP